MQPKYSRNISLDAASGNPDIESVLKLSNSELDALLAKSYASARQIWNVLQKLPVIEVGLSLRGWWADGQEEEDRQLPNTFIVGIPKDDDFLAVHADQEYVLQVNLNRIQRQYKPDTKAHAPRFPKAKDEGWFLVLGDVDNKELLALKRVGYVRGRNVVQLAFYTPETTGRVIYALYMMSDSYLGMDQQYSICLDVKEANIEAQLNTEVILDGTGSDLEAELAAEEE